MSRPPIEPSTTTSGIALDPQTLERVIPESRRADGTVRKQLKVRPGFTPQEDVQRFRGTRQVQAEASALPKGHIVGWAPPSNTVQIKVAQSQSAKKNAKRKEKKKEKKDDELQKKIAESWEDSDDEPPAAAKSKVSEKEGSKADSKAPPEDQTSTEGVDGLSEQLEKLEVK